MAKKKDDRARVWTMIVYPESAPKDWKEKINGKHIAWACILHDKDVNPDGTKKKPHYHVVLVFEGKKSYSQIKAIADELNSPIPQKVESLRGMMRYLIHMDNPEKYQYTKDQIESYGGLDYEDYLKSMGTAKRAVLKEIAQYIVDNEIVSYADLTIKAIEESDDWFDAVSTNTIFLGRLCDDVWKKQNRQKYENTSGESEANKLDQIKQARDMAKKGIKQQEIADTLGVNRSTLYRWLKG